MNIIIIQLALFCANLVMISLVITPAALKVKKSASPDGVAKIVTDQSASTDACMERANDQVFVNAATAIKEHDAMNAKRIQDAKTASVQSHGSVAASKTGVESSATKVSNN